MLQEYKKSQPAPEGWKTADVKVLTSDTLDYLQNNPDTVVLLTCMSI
jgi:hypothetical protein